ncbi:MAG TPA: MerR family transcriptional regulator [Mycobacteriales bacterium]|nr:MerR family transcriptional regulator [Mycobacteriales bacterium]
MESLLGIGALARQSGLSVSALRFYDGAGVLVPASVDPRTGYRRYAVEQVAAARLIARLRRVGLPLASVRALLDGADPGPVLDAHLAALEDGLAAARRELSAVRTFLGRSEPLVNLTVPAAALDAVAYAIGRDPAYPALHGVLLDAVDGTLHVVATDRYRLAVATAPAPGVSGRAFLPVAVVAAVRGTAFTVTGDGAELVVTAGDRTVRVPAAADGFPDWRRLEPAPAAHRVVVDGPAFRAAVSAGAATRKDHHGVAYDAIVLTLDGGELGVGGAGGTLAVGVNRDYLLDALGRHDQLVLELDGPITPLAIRLPDGADWSLLMPVDMAG